MNRGRHLRSWGRNALLWGLCAFAAVQASISLAMATHFPHWRDPATGTKVACLEHRLHHLPGHPLLVLALGSSRTTWDLAGTPIEQQVALHTGRPVVFFNMGLLGAGPATNLIGLRRVLADFGRPDLVLVEVLPIRLAGQVAQDELTKGFLPAGRLRRDEVPLVEHYSARRRPGLLLDWWLARLVPGHGHRLEILSSLWPSALRRVHQQNQYRHLDASGWMPYPLKSVPPEKRRRVLQIEGRAMTRYLKGFRPDGPALEALCQILHDCKSARVPAVLVVLPESSEYRGWYPPASRQQVEALLDRLSRFLDVPVIDTREWMTDDAFADSQHLLPGEALTFSGRLGKEVIAPLLAGVSHGSPPFQRSSDDTRAVSWESR
jgi:hypothetical protein